LTEQLVELNVLWNQMNRIEQINWLNEARRIQQKRAWNLIVYVCLGASIISIIFIISMPPTEFHHYIFALIGGYIVSLNIFALEWIIEKFIHKKHGRHLPS